MKHVRETLVSPFSAELNLYLDTDKVKDPEELDGYNQATFAHHFSFSMLVLGGPGNGEETEVSGKNVFKVDCDRKSGVITSSYDAPSSVPSGLYQITKSTVVGAFSVDLTIYIVRDQGGPDLTTKVFGALIWYDTENPDVCGYWKVPWGEGTNLTVVNTFTAKKHS